MNPEVSLSDTRAEQAKPRIARIATSQLLVSPPRESWVLAILL